MTGGEGFVGHHLVTRLESCGHEVVPTSRDGEVGQRLKLPDRARTRELISDLAPDAVFHLAGVTSVGAAAHDPADAYTVNVLGTHSLLEAIDAERPECHLVYVSSSSVYGPSPATGQPLTEDSPTRPRDVYGWTKLAAESTVHACADRFTILRPFNHTGPGQRPDFALPDFARQIVAVERGEQEPALAVGDLSVCRDFVDVRDVVNAYAGVLDLEPVGQTFNVCAGTSVRLADLVALLCKHATVNVEIVVDPGRVRDRDVDLQVGSGASLQSATGWVPSTPLEKTMEDLLEDWRRREGR